MPPQVLFKLLNQGSPSVPQLHTCRDAGHDNVSPRLVGLGQRLVAASLGYWDSLHGFSGVLLSSVYAASVTGHGLLLTAAYGLLTGSKAVLSGLLAALLAPVGWLLWILTSNATLIILAISLFLAWQVYYPSRWTLRWLSRLPNFQGVLFDLPPSENLDAAGVKPYVALTLNDFPCKYNTEPLLDLLAKHDAKATFFIAGAQVEKLDALGAGNGHHELGKATLRRMVAEGHELGNQTWHIRPSHALTTKQLTQEVLNTHELISAARHVALAASAARLALDDEEDEETHSSPTEQRQPQQLLNNRRCRWFRPSGGWLGNEMVEAAQKLGYTTVLGSVFPWDTVKLPRHQALVHAVYIWSKAYSGAVIVLHNRRETLLTLEYVLPWLRQWGYDIITLGEAAAISSQGQSDLTVDALEVHNELLGMHTLNSQGPLARQSSGWAHSEHSYGGSIPRQFSSGSVKQLDGMIIGPDKLKVSAAYVAQMAKERERAAMIAAAEEAERARLKAAKRAEADRKAGIDRRLVDMSAAEKRAIERREREKKEADKRRARRKVEEVRARERYELYVQQKALEEAERRKADEAAAVKAQQEEERKKKAAEELKKRQEAEKAAAAALRARLKQEQEEAAAAEAAAAAAAAAAGITPADDALARDSVSTVGSVSQDKKKGKLSGFWKKLGGKRGNAKQGSSMADNQVGAATTAAGIAAAGGVVSTAAAAAAFAGRGAESAHDAAAAAAYPAVSYGARTVSATAATASGHSSNSNMCHLPHETYAWYGMKSWPESQAMLASIDAALAELKATITEAAEAAAAAAGTPGSGGISSSSFAEYAAAAAAHAARLPPPVVGRYALGPTGRVLLGFDAQPLLLSEGPDNQAVVLNSQGEALSGPNGEQIALLLGCNGTPLVDPYGRPVMVALQPGTGRPLAVHPDGSIVMVPACPASAAAQLSGSAAVAVAAAAAVGKSGVAPLEVLDASPSSSIKEAQSYAPSLARSSSNSHVSAATPPAAHGEAAAAGCASHAAGSAKMVPAELLLGPHGKPLLGLDNRPLIVAVDEEGVPLVLSAAGGMLLMGPDDRPLVLAVASDGNLVALDSQCRPLTGPDGRPRFVALDRDGRPMVDEDSGRPVLLSLGPNGLPVADSLGASRRVSWAGSASGARLSHSGTQSNLVLAAQPGTGLEVMVGTRAGILEDGAELLEVVDAADYGQFSAASLSAVGAGAGPQGSCDRQLSFSHEKSLQQRLLALGEEEDEQLQQQASGLGVALAPAVNEAYATAGGSQGVTAATATGHGGFRQGTAPAAGAVGDMAAIAGDAAYTSKDQMAHRPASEQQQHWQQQEDEAVSFAVPGKGAGLYDQHQLVELTASGTLELTAAAVMVKN